jgi:hypothetical protein
MRIYSYLIEHDFGLAPNPFGGYCTLAVCKPKIRKSKNLKKGDWIIGTGSKALENVSGKVYSGKLIYAMRVDEIITFEQYWNDERFQYKKPNLNGSLQAIYGDNIYHKESGVWIQSDSAHSLEGGEPNLKHLKKDIGGENVIISENFYYFGDQAPKIPSALANIAHTGVGEKLVLEKYHKALFEWLFTFEKGIKGDPINWIIYNQHQLF